MSLLLPPKDHPANKMVDKKQLASLDDVQNRLTLPDFRKAKALAEKILSDRAIHSTNILVYRQNGDLELVEFSRTGAKTLWNFGKL